MLVVAYIGPNEQPPRSACLAVPLKPIASSLQGRLVVRKRLWRKMQRERKKKVYRMGALSEVELAAAKELLSIPSHISIRFIHHYISLGHSRIGEMRPYEI